MLRFLWHWLFHWMRPTHEHWAQDLTTYYLCKCGKAFTIVRGWREERKWFTDIEETDAEELKTLLAEIRRDVRTL